MGNGKVYTDYDGRVFVERDSGKRHYEQHCDHCGEKFFPKRAGQKYCSNSCNVRAYQKRKGRGKKSEVQALSGTNAKAPFAPTKQGTADVMLGNLLYDSGKAIGKNLLGVKSEMEQDIKDIKAALSTGKRGKIKAEVTGRIFDARVGNTLVKLQEVLIDDRPFYRLTEPPQKIPQTTGLNPDLI